MCLFGQPPRSSEPALCQGTCSTIISTYKSKILYWKKKMLSYSVTKGKQNNLKLSTVNVNLLETERLCWGFFFNWIHIHPRKMKVCFTNLLHTFPCQVIACRSTAIIWPTSQFLTTNAHDSLLARRKKGKRRKISVNNIGCIMYIAYQVNICIID